MALPMVLPPKSGHYPSIRQLPMCVDGGGQRLVVRSPEGDRKQLKTSDFATVQQSSPIRNPDHGKTPYEY